MPLKSLSNINQTQYAIGIAALSYIGAIAVLFSGDMNQLHQTWTTSSELTHGYPALAIALWLIIRNGKSHEQKPSALMLVPLLIIAISYSIGDILTIKTIKLLALLLALPTFIAVVAGPKSLRFTLIPTLIIGMALPATYLAIPILQKLTVIANTFLIKQLGMTAYIEGSYIHLSSGVIWVKNGCSGHKYFTSAVTLALIMISLDRFSSMRSLIITSLALGLSLLANWIRVFLLILVAYYTSVDHPLIHDHDNFGWVVFGISMVPLFLFWRNCTPLPNKKEEPTPTRTPTSTHKRTLIYAVAGLIFMALPLGASHRLQQTETATVPPLNNMEFSSFRLVDDRQNIPWQPEYKGADYQLRFTHKTKPILLAIDQYNHQGTNKELDSTENRIFPKRWHTLEKHTVAITLANGDHLTALTESASHSRYGKYMALYWHSVNGVAVMPGVRSKLQLLTKLRGSVSPDYLFSLASSCGENCEQALEGLRQEARALQGPKLK
ncbi:MAG: exosortase [Pseudomonadales bacterium]|nr:exosortase [Pseudomonadales bacterium]